MKRGKYLPGSYAPRTPAYAIGYTGEGTAAPDTSTTLTVTLADSADPTPAGNNFDITAVVVNTGANSAANVSLAVTIPVSTTFVSASGTGWSCNHSAGVVTCTRASLTVGTAPTVTITVTAGNSAASITTSATVIADNAVQAVDSEGTTVTRPTWTATLGDSADPVINGKNFNITLDLTNNGMSGVGTINNASVTVTLDANLTWVSSSGMTGWTLGHSGQNVTATKSSFVVGSATQLVITVTAAQSATTSASTSVTCTADNAANATDTETTQLNFITRDATSGIYLPSSSTEWTNFKSYHSLSIPTPNSLWLCQESSGNLADSIGSSTLTANGTPLYQQTNANLTRKCVGFNAGANQRFAIASGTAPNPNTTSVLQCWYGCVTATPGASSQVVSTSDTAGSLHRVTVTTTPIARLTTIAVSADGVNNPVSTTPTPWVLEYDRANSRANAFVGTEKITGTYSASVADGRKMIGGATAPTAQFAYGMMWTGANAEGQMANLKACLQAMGFTVSWSP